MLSFCGIKFMQRIFLLSFLFLISQLSFAFQIRSVVLLKGFALDFQSKAPLEMEFFLVMDSIRLVVKTSKDGSFYIPINTSGEYQILSKKYFNREPKSLKINIQNNYTETEIIFYFEPIEIGYTICDLIGFEKGTDELTTKAISFLKFIGKQNKITPGIFYRIEINTSDVFFKDTFRMEKIGKKIKKIKISAQEQANDLISRRIQKIKENILSLRLPERNIQFVSNPVVNLVSTTQKSAKVKKSKQSPIEKTNNNFKIIVDKIMDFTK